MDSYEILKKVHKVGHPISGIVKGFEKYENLAGIESCGIELETDSIYQSILPFDNLFDESKPFREELLPPIGSEIKGVVKNHVDNCLYLSAKPSDLDEKQIQGYREFYKYVESIPEGTQKTGTVKLVKPFGIFVDLSLPFIGLIDIGHISFNGGKKLPYDPSLWPKEGESIECVISYFRFDDKQFGLGWIK